MNHNPSNLLIHIGYHKSASSWFQQKLFTTDSKVFEPFSLTDRGHSTLARYFIYDDEGYLLSPFEYNKMRIRKEVENIIKSKADFDSKIPVISHERLSGNPHSSGFDARKIALMLKSTFPQANILIVFREQKSFILSSYFEFLAQGGTCSLNKYLNTKYDGKRPFFSPHHIEYLSLISEYYNLYGKDRVIVLPWELFKTKPSVFINTIGKALNIDIGVDDKLFKIIVNEHKFKFAIYYLRILNNCREKSSLNNYSSLVMKYASGASKTLINTVGVLLPNRLNTILKERFKQQIEEWVGDRYVESNKQLSTLVGIDLSEYDYY